MTAWRILCDDAELAVDAARGAEQIHLEAEPEIAAPLPAALRALEDGGADLRVALLFSSAPSPADLAELAAVARRSSAPAPVGVVAAGDARRAALEVAGDLGLVAVGEVAPLLAALALSGASSKRPWLASTRALSSLERTRLGPDAVLTGRGGGRLLRADDGFLAWAGRTKQVLLGPPAAAGDALRALRRATEATPPSRAVLEGIDRRQTEDVLFGPPRALSDPASKAALDPYGVPLPLEELCTSPSRAAAEAARLGFPVRIALASPDLRLWDHPDLAVDGVGSAAQVRDVYRQILALGMERAPDARLLGVTVTATTQAEAWLRLVASPLAGGRVLGDIGFADPHGWAASDRTCTVLPASEEAVERVLGRLAGAPLLLDGPAARRRAVVGSLTDLFLRISAFLDDRRREVVRVELNPLVLSVGGALEVREACIEVGDAYLRTLEAPAPPP